MMREKLVGMLLAGIGLLAIAGGAEAAAKLELLGQPCRAKNILASLMVKDRTTGREYFVLSNMNENSNAELIFVDFENDTAKVYKAPAGAGSWALHEAPGDRLIVGTFYDGVFMTFDLKKMEFVKVSQFPGESYIWNLARGGDGRVYGGTYPHGKLGALNLDDYSVEDLGAAAPPNMYLRYVYALPDGRILCQFTTEKPTSMIFDPVTKQFSPAPTKLTGGATGVSWNGYFLSGRQVFDGKTLEEIVPTPFPTPPAGDGIWGFNTKITTADTVYMTQGAKLYKYKLGDKEVTPACDLDLRKWGIQGVAENGDLLGLRGQDYYVIKPGDKEVKLRPIPGVSSPRGTLFLRVDPNGTLWGGPTFGQTLWHMDPVTKEYVNTATICDAGGEVYDVAFANGKVYAVSYAGGDTVEYDPSQPWDQLNQKNPRVIKRVGPDYIRPEGGVTLGPDGKLYTGWLAKYGTYGGAISIIDPKTGDTELIKNPLGEQAILTVISDGKFAYAGSTLAGNGLPNKADEFARFGIIDLATKETVFQHEFDGCHSVHVLAFDPESKRLMLSIGGEPMLFDTSVRGFVSELPGAAKVGGRSVGIPGDGTVLYASEKSVMRLDMRTGKTTKVIEAPANVTNVACGQDGRLYISCDVDVYAVK